MTIHGTPPEMLVTLVIIMTGGAAVLNVVLKVLGLYSRGLPTLIATLAALCVSPFHWPTAALAVLPFALGFKSGRTTRVMQIPGDFLSMVSLTPRAYTAWAKRMALVGYSEEMSALMLSPRLDWSEKMHLIMHMWTAAIYRRAPLWVLITAPFYFWFWSMANTAVLIAMISLPFGAAVGMLLTFVH